MSALLQAAFLWVSSAIPLAVVLAVSLALVGCGGGKGIGEPCEASPSGAAECASGVCAVSPCGVSICTGLDCDGVCASGESCKLISGDSINMSYCVPDNVCGGS